MNHPETIDCLGVKTHNLQNIDLKIPLHAWTAITGVSGSGKSSFVFHTLYSEAQRRFLETLGTYERQFLGGLPQGDFRSIDEIPAAVALKQSNRTGDPRSMIGSSADVFEPLRTVFAAFMNPSCVKCGTSVEQHSSKDAQQQIVTLWQSNPDVLACVALNIEQDNKQFKALIKTLVMNGHTRMYTGSKILDLEDMTKPPKEPSYLILDRLQSNTPCDELTNRLESVWSQIRFSPTFSELILIPVGQTPQQPLRVQPFCKSCQQPTTTIQGSDLDWHSVLGACKICQGLGNVPVIDVKKVIPNPSVTLENGAIKPWTTETFGWLQSNLLKQCKIRKIATNIPYDDLSESDRDWIWNSRKEQSTEHVSVTNFFETLEAERYKSHSRILLAKYRRYVTCSGCEGFRLGAAGRNAKCGEVSYQTISNQEIAKTRDWLASMAHAQAYTTKMTAVSEIYKETLHKLDTLVKLGLGSSQLSRRCRSLSGGEYQRVLLSRVLGNGLTDALYVLDEPSVGLGPSEIPNMISCIQELKDLGNTIVMVEHDPQLIRAADHVFEFGPGGGTNGGKLVDFVSEPVSLSIAAPLPKVPKRKSVSGRLFAEDKAVRLEGFTCLNCHNLELEVPFGKLTAIAGPSGAGKTTLIQKGLNAALEALEDNQLTNNVTEDLDAHRGVWKHLHVPNDFWKTHQVVSVEQKAMHRSSASVPATILGVFDALRKALASTHQAKALGLTASHFSFNGQGACETCDGKGIVKEDLFFLGNVEKTCPACNGTRFIPKSLLATWLGKNISQWLDTSIQECAEAFKKLPAMCKPLQLAVALGIGHLPLGMSSSAISGGEAQRLRLTAALTKSDKFLFCLLDEPTRGLSEKDVGDLILALLNLTSQGHTFVIVEHHKEILNYAHQLILLGPGSGQDGGHIVERLYV